MGLVRAPNTMVLNSTSSSVVVISVLRCASSRAWHSRMELRFSQPAPQLRIH